MKPRERKNNELGKGMELIRDGIDVTITGGKNCRCICSPGGWGYGNEYCGCACGCLGPSLDIDNSNANFNILYPEQ